MRTTPASLLFAATLLIAAPAAALAQCCLVPDNGAGTANTPPGCAVGYLGSMEAVNGFPAGSTLQFVATLTNFTSLTQTPGGPLGGQTETWSADLNCQITGTGTFTGYVRNLTIPVTGTSHSAPRTPFTPYQTFPTDLFQMQGQIGFPDPDFDLLRVTAGTNFGMPSPGNTALNQVGPNWAVASFFDIRHRVDFIGKPATIFGGQSGSTTNTRRFSMCGDDPTPARRASWGRLKTLYR